MLGLFFIYFLGKKFYQLAELYQQNKWLFAVLSVLMYYVSGFLFGVLFFIIGEFVSPGFVDATNENLINFIVIPIGLLSCWGFYVLLERKWKNTVRIEIESIDDIGKPMEE